MDKLLTKDLMLKALKALDKRRTAPLTLILGGGGAMILAHKFPLATLDLDAIPVGSDFSELDLHVKEIAKELNLPGDWLNPYFSTFSHTLPSDFKSRLITVFKGTHILAQALGREDMLILKCFAHRQKDIPHARALIKNGADLKLVERQIEELKKKGIPGANEALDFLDDVTEDA